MEHNNDRRDAQGLRGISSDSLARNPFVSGKPYNVIADTDGIVRIGLEAGSVPRGVMVVDSPFACSASFSRIRPGRFAEIKLTRHWEFLSRKDVDTNLTADFNFDAPCFGETDYDYKVEGFWKANGGSAQVCRWRLNDAASSLSNEGSTYRLTSSSTSVDTSGLVLSVMSQVEPAELRFCGYMRAKAGANRLGFAESTETFGTTTSTQEHMRSGYKWEDTAVEITTVGLAFSGNDCLTGSWFELYRRPEFDKTELTLWVY